MKSTSRWIYAAAGAIILLFAGIIYAWSVISTPIAAEFSDWSNAQLSTTFTLAMAFFCLSALGRGSLASKIPPNVCLWISSVLFLLGAFLSARTSSPVHLYIGFGVLCGAASGIAYNVVISDVTKLFPEKQGMISGGLLMGFALGSFIMGKAYQAFTPNEAGAWRDSFLLIGVLIAVVIFICSFFFRRMPGAVALPPEAKTATAAARDVDTISMIKKPSFWLFYIWSIVLTADGLVVISQASGMARDVSSVISDDSVATIVGLISVFNGIGRIFFGSLYDKKGQMVTMMSSNLLFLLTAALMTVTLKSHSVVLLTLSFVIAGLGYSCISPTASAFIKDYYGPVYFPVNYPVVMTNMLIASFASTFAGALYDRSGSYITSFVLLAALAGVGMVSTIAISLSEKKRR